jgi:pyrroloquinoline quinone biosynthesis protein B
MALELCVLGSAAGGAFPQWNCGCDNCRGVRAGDVRFVARSEDSLALWDGERCFLVNASPGVNAQLVRHPEFWPKALRGSPVEGVILTNGDIDHTLGLFTLREWQPLAVYATTRVREGLERNAMLATLLRREGQLVWRELPLDEPVVLCGPTGAPTSMRVEAFAAPGKPPLHLAQRGPHLEDNVGLVLRGTSDRRAVYASSTALLEPIAARLRGADVLLLDGTFWSEDEPRKFGAPLGARAMGHVPIGGPEGSLAGLEALAARNVFYTHVNNTNPVLDAASAERRAVVEAGAAIAEDGLRLTL